MLEEPVGGTGSIMKESVLFCGGGALQTCCVIGGRGVVCLGRQYIHLRNIANDNRIPIMPATGPAMVPVEVGFPEIGKSVRAC